MENSDLAALAAANPEEIVKLSMAPADIDKFNKLVEAYDNLALVSTLDAAAGLVILWVTADTRKTALKLISKLPFAVKVIDDTGESEESR